MDLAARIRIFNLKKYRASCETPRRKAPSLTIQGEQDLVLREDEDRRHFGDGLDADLRAHRQGEGTLHHRDPGRHHLTHAHLRSLWARWGPFKQRRVRRDKQ